MATKICTDCLRELPEENFAMYRTGKRISVCHDCVARKKAFGRAKIHDKNRAMRLGDYATSTLFEELASRGVIGKVYVDGNEFNIADYHPLKKF